MLVSVYVMSDVHGWKARFDAVLESLALHDSDHLYIVGDVIDRGPDGIEILIECMRNNKITLLMGNHEYMMLEVLKRSKQLADRIDMYDAVIAIERWFRNGCRPTLEAFESLSKALQKELEQYLESCPLAICDLRVQDRCYYLVHAHPVLTYTKGIVTLDQLSGSEVKPDRFVWDRILSYQSFFKDRCVIFGHTMTEYYQQNHPYAIWSGDENLMNSDLIGIDCGCAAANEHTRLACLCLDTMQVRYF